MTSHVKCNVSDCEFQQQGLCSLAPEYVELDDGMCTYFRDTILEQQPIPDPFVEVNHVPSP